MPKAHQITEQEISEIKIARKKSKDIKEEKRLHAIELRGTGMTNKQVAEKLDTSEKVIGNWMCKFKKEGLSGLLKKGQKGNRRNLTFEQEREFLSKYEERANKGQIIDVAEMKEDYIKLVGHSIGTSQIYCVLKRHGWRKVMPRSKHPKKSSEEVIEASKKLTIWSRS